MKVVMLIPCLMLQNNREANKKLMRFAKEYYKGIDEFIVNDQEFIDSDYEEGFTYIGHHKERQGFVNTRNQLLEYFYNSDADWAIWMDANSRVSKTSLNDFITLIDAVKQGKVEVDVVLSTLGIIVSGERIDAKKRSDYFEKIYLTKVGNGYDWLHAAFMKNLKKYHNKEIYIDPEAEPRKAGMTEDVFFVRILRRLFDVRLCPTIVVTKAGVKTSTWAASETGKYNYPKNGYDATERAIDKFINYYKLMPVKQTTKSYEYDRVELYKEDLKPYKPRSRVKSNLLKRKD